MKKILAFSLIELMISLITISCITAAFAPIITKKMKNSNVSVALSEISTKCDKFTSECSLCYSSKCVACSRYCNDNQYKNVSTCLCENCVDRSVGCIRCDAKECKKCDLGYGLTSDGKCRLCPKGYYSDGTYDCRACSVDQYQNQEGKSSCINCPTAQGSEIGSASCTTCSSKIANCYECSNLTQCTKCNAGYYLNSSNTCTICPAGYKCDGTTNKIACTAGTYSGAGASSCTACPSGQYQDATAQSSCKSCASKTANCTNCNAATGVCNGCGGGYMISGTSCVPKYPHTKTANGSTQYINIDNSTFNVVIATIIGAGGGGGGGNVKTDTVPASPVTPQFCQQYGWVYFASGPHCAITRNAGDGNDLNAPSQAFIRNVSGVILNYYNGNLDSYANRGWNCWYGQTGKGGTTWDPVYDGAFRTVCQYQAAKAICAAWAPNGVYGWQLPANYHLSAWKDVLKSSTMHVCNRYGGCGWNTAECQQNHDVLRPHYIAMNGYGSDYIWIFDNCAASDILGTWRSENVRDPNDYNVTNRATSVRCILSQIPASTTETPFRGGGGGSGYSASNIVIPDSTIASARGGKIRLTAGTGGAGGAMGANGANGNATKVEVLNASGGVIWTKSVSVGSGGKTATASANGAGGAGAAAGATGGAGGGSGYGAGGAGGSGHSAGANGAAGYISVTYQDANP